MVRADFIRYDQQTPFLDRNSALPTQNAWLLEGNYYFHKAKFAPFIQYASTDLTDRDMADSQKIQGGVAYYVLENKINIKAGFGRLLQTGSPDRNQFIVQGQFYYF